MECDSEPTRAEIRKWPTELKAMRKGELHRQRMLRFRGRRAMLKKSMEEECRRLEQELEQRLAHLRRNSVCTSHSRATQVQQRMQQLVLEREWLQEESVQLCQKLGQHRKVTQFVQSTVKTIAPTLSTDTTQGHSDVTSAFPDEPSVFLPPFSQQEFDEALHHHDEKSGRTASELVCVGVYLGWNVYHGAVAPGKQWLSDQVRCIKRIDRSIDSLVGCLTSEEGEGKWPLTATARDIYVTAEIDTQTVQVLNENKLVLVRNIHGGVNARYLCLIERARLEVVEGKRRFKFYYVIGDSKANARGREVESMGQDDVHWITDDGGYSLTLNEFRERRAGSRPFYHVRPYRHAMGSVCHVLESSYMLGSLL
ncbi:hypothetical protein GN244_ATG08188 [Phytophthora infestans]|uniref:Uncharacterized protein n=1 Tax=Phytophthora infestans TaxID=4787 RepID=A0A833W2E3_PHYIN|nr:hypothetical protein GN244_ATG08188 [Phytophthora infestans]